jgi:hypothetical protein
MYWRSARRSDGCRQPQPKGDEAWSVDGKRRIGQVSWSGFSGVARFYDCHIDLSINEIDIVGLVGQVLMATYMLSKGIQ